MGDLRRYREKRDPESTPEPFGEGSRARAAPPGTGVFAVQQHAARRMHWDLRLEIGEVLASWAVPRGPVLDPSERRLAVRTEDHPREYADFEGVIPAGNYGAGAMILWDRGIYRSVAGDPAEGLESGKLDLWLEGHKLRGRFALVRTKAGGGRDWLLLYKGKAQDAAGELVEEQSGSVLSGLTVAELTEAVVRDAELDPRARELGAKPGTPDAARLRPMLASRGDEPFSRAGWLFELKYDGVRVLAEKRGDEARLFARAGGERTALYPELQRALAHLPVSDAILDGEVVALDERGRSSFERIQRRFTVRSVDEAERLEREIPVQLRAFDLLAVCGLDLRPLPLRARKELLARLAPARGFVAFADHVEGDGLALFEAAQRNELEGVVAKRADSPYESGRRSRAWVKLKVPRSATLAVVGYTHGRGSRTDLGSLMVAWRDGAGWRHAGNVGSGLDDATLDVLREQLPSLESATAGFEIASDAPAAAGFVRPEIFCEVRYTEVTRSGLLRHPVFVRLLPDATPDDCTAFSPRDEPMDAAPAPGGGKRQAKLELTRLDKVFWPTDGYTKGDLLHWYEAAWPWLAPYLRDRPVVLTRYPDGVEGKSFYQKNAPDFTPDWVERRRIDDTDYFICNDLRTLLYVINSGAIPLHVWSARTVALDRPDWLILDLDPKQAPWRFVVEIARHLRRLFADLGVGGFVKTSGQDGLHVMLPLGASLGHDEARRLAEVIARVVCADLPEIATIARPLAARGDRVYVDALQNGRGKLIAAPLSVRPRAGAPVSMPLTWRQVGPRLAPERWNIRTAIRRLRSHGDPFSGVLGPGIDVPELLEALQARLGGESG